MKNKKLIILFHTLMVSMLLVFYFGSLLYLLINLISLLPLIMKGSER